MEYVVNNILQAHAALEYFNAFHDGFLKTVVVTITPTEGEEFSYGKPVRYDAKLDIVHTNYGRVPRQKVKGVVSVWLNDLQGIAIGNIVAYDTMLGGAMVRENNGYLEFDLDSDSMVQFTCRTIRMSDSSGAVAPQKREEGKEESSDGE